MTMDDRDNVLPLPRRDEVAPRSSAQQDAAQDKLHTADSAASDKLVPAVVFQVQRLRRQLNEGLDAALDASREIRDSFARLQHQLTLDERRALTDYVAQRLKPDQQAADLHAAAQRSIRDGDFAEMERIRDALAALIATPRAEMPLPNPALPWSQVQGGDDASASTGSGED